MTALVYSKKGKEVIVIVYEKNIIPPDWPWDSDFDTYATGSGDTVDLAISRARDAAILKEACAKEG